MKLEDNKYIFELVIDGSQNKELMNELPLFDQLKSLTIKKANIYDKDIMVINKLSQLIELTFINCNFFNKLETFTNNNVLKISFVGEEIEDYKILSKMKRLRYIDVIDSQEVELTNIFTIANLSELRVLNSKFLSTTDLFRISNQILLEISGSSGIIKEEINTLKSKFNFVDNGIFVIEEGANNAYAWN